jgi:hypothetical protein
MGAVRSSAGGKQLCCRFRPVLAELRPAYETERKWRLEPYMQAKSSSETGTGRAPAGTTKSFPTALVRSVQPPLNHHPEGEADMRWRWRSHSITCSVHHLLPHVPSTPWLSWGARARNVRIRS